MQNSCNLHCYIFVCRRCHFAGTVCLCTAVTGGYCASELEFLDMAINVKKSACMRFGTRYRNMCCEVVVSGHSINWVESARYFGVYLVSSTKFKCSFSNNKAVFFQGIQ